MASVQYAAASGPALLVLELIGREPERILGLSSLIPLNAGGGDGG